MCTAATYQGKNYYFGRNLDYEFDYGQKVLVTGRNYPMHFNHVDDLNNHYAMIGMGITLGNLPQYLAQFELVPYILATCCSIKK